MTAYASLRHDRPVGLAGAGPIPWSSIERYARRFNLDNDDLQTLEFYLRRMDAAVREYEAKNKDTPTPNQKGAKRR